MATGWSAWSARKIGWWVYGILALLTVWQLANASSEPPLWADQHCYLKLGESLAAGSGYSTNGFPYAHAPPGWPVLIAAVIRLFGDSELVFVRISIVLGMAGLGLAWRVLQQSHGAWAAAGAVALVATSSTYFTHVTRTAGSEAPFTLLLYGALALVVWQKEPWPRWAGIATAALVGAAVLTRTVGVTIIAGLALWAWTEPGNRRKRAWAGIAGGLVAAAAWFLYTSSVSGLESEGSLAEFLRSGSGVTTLLGRAPENLMAQGFDLVRTGIVSVQSSFFSPEWILPIAGIAASGVGAGLMEWVAVAWIAAFLLFLTAGGRYAIPILPILYVSCGRGWQRLLRPGTWKAALLWGAAALAVLYFLDGRPRPAAREGIEWLAAALLIVVFARTRFAPAVIALICTAGLVQQVRVTAAGYSGDPGWRAMVRMTGWMRGNTNPRDAVIVQDGLDCAAARLAPNPAFYWADGLTGEEEVRIVRARNIRYVFRINFTDAEGDRVKVARALAAAPGLLRPVYESADFQVFETQLASEQPR